MAATSSAVPGQRLVTDGTEQLNAIDFIVRMALGRLWTSTVVQVITVHGGGLGKAGTVDILPLVNQIDSEGTATPHATIFGVPFARLQGAGNAVICDPVAGDVGVAVFASRDISSVKANGAQANPGSWRRFDAADGLYLFSIIGATPTQYVEYLPNGGGINIISPGNVTINGVVITPSGQVEVPQNVIAGFGGGDQVGLQTHQHPTAAPGSPSPPTPGT